MFTWKAKDDENSDKEGPIASSSKGVENDIVNRIANTCLGVHKRHYFTNLALKLSPPHSTLLQIFSLSIWRIVSIWSSEIRPTSRLGVDTLAYMPADGRTIAR